MYEHYWGLSSSPFSNRVRNISASKAIHEEALARLLYCVEQSKSFAVLQGPAGCGKSYLFQVLGEQIRRSQRFFASIDLAQMNSHEFLESLRTGFRLGGKPAETAMDCWRQLTDFFTAATASGIQSVLLLQGLDQAEDSTVDAIRRLLCWSSSSSALVTIIASMTEGRTSAKTAGLLSLAELGIEIQPLEVQETEAYVRNRLESSGSQRALFQSDAIEQLHRLTGGLPREINRLCDLALLAGMNESRAAIDRDLIAGLTAEYKLPVSALDS